MVRARVAEARGSKPRQRASVPAALRPRRPARKKSDAEFAGFVRRTIRAHAARVAAGEIEHLASLAAARDAVEEGLRLAIAGQRQQGKSWTKIGDVLGISKQAAQQRYGS